MWRFLLGVTLGDNNIRTLLGWYAVYRNELTPDKQDARLALYLIDALESPDSYDLELRQMWAEKL